MAHGVV